MTIRRLLNFLTALSLLLCVAAAALWIRSFWVADLLTDFFYRPRGDHLLRVWPLVRSERGGVSFRVKTSHCAGPAMPYPSDRRQADPARRYPVFQPLPANYPAGVPGRVRHWRREGAGFQFAHIDYEGDTDTNVTMPHATWLVLFLVVPAARLRRLMSDRAAARAGLALCPACGYDLRATPGRCPECGTAATR